MATTIPFSVSYTQKDDGQHGSITLNSETITASGRLDNIGDFVFAEGFTTGIHSTTVECVRTSKNTMQIRILFIVESYRSYNYQGKGLEKVIDDVKINFE